MLVEEDVEEDGERERKLPMFPERRLSSLSICLCEEVYDNKRGEPIVGEDMEWVMIFEGDWEVELEREEEGKPGSMESS